VLIISYEREDGVIQSLWRNDRTFHQAIHTQARFFIFTYFSYVNDRINHGELEILAYICLEAHDIDILNELILP